MGERKDGDEEAGRGSMEFTAAFASKYEEAIRDLSEDDVAFVASLSAARLQEYVYSPARIRPFKLHQWRAQEAAPAPDLLTTLRETMAGIRTEDVLHLVLQLLSPRAAPAQAGAAEPEKAPGTRDP